MVGEVDVGRVVDVGLEAGVDVADVVFVVDGGALVVVGVVLLVVGDTVVVLVVGEAVVVDGTELVVVDVVLTGTSGSATLSSAPAAPSMIPALATQAVTASPPAARYAAARRCLRRWIMSPSCEPPARGESPPRTGPQSRSRLDKYRPSSTRR